MNRDLFYKAIISFSILMVIGAMAYAFMPCTSEAVKVGGMIVGHRCL